MTRFELRTSGVGSNRSTNKATTTAHKKIKILLHTKLKTCDFVNIGLAQFFP